MSVVGVKIDQFDDPVCNSFQAKIQNDQLCYEVDLNKYANKNNIHKALKSGFRFILDFNEDRQVLTITEGLSVKETYGNDWFDKFNPDAEADDHYASIYLDTIGKELSMLI